MGGRADVAERCWDLAYFSGYQALPPGEVGALRFRGPGGQGSSDQNRISCRLAIASILQITQMAISKTAVGQAPERTSLWIDVQ